MLERISAGSFQKYSRIFLCDHYAYKKKYRNRIQLIRQGLINRNNVVINNIIKILYINAINNARVNH